MLSQIMTITVENDKSVPCGLKPLIDKILYNNYTNRI